MAGNFSVDTLNFLFFGYTDYNRTVPVHSPNGEPNTHIAWFNTNVQNIGKPKNITELFATLLTINSAEVGKFLKQDGWQFTPATFADMFDKEITSKAAGASFSHSTNPAAAHWSQLKLEFARNSLL